jgi:ketosteroid isomerase-like protein
MSASNVELFRLSAEATMRGDEPALLELVDERFELEPLRAATEGTFHGHDGVRAFLKDTADSFERFDLTYDDVRDLGDDRVLALGSIHIRGRGSGVETEVPTAVIASFRDGRMTHFKDYGEHETALAAAGLA